VFAITTKFEIEAGFVIPAKAGTQSEVFVITTKVEI
jgi:hypothetical protein